MENIKREASKVGITCESFGEWNNLARRYARLGDTENEIKCLKKALEIHNIWGKLDSAYGASENTIQTVEKRLKKAESVNG